MLVLRPSIDSSRIRTNDPLVARGFDDIDVVLDEYYNYMDLAYLLIHGSLGASFYHQVDVGLVSALLYPVGPQLVSWIVLNTVWLPYVLTICFTRPQIFRELVLLEVLLYRSIRFREGGLKYLCIPQLHILCNFCKFGLTHHDVFQSY